MDRNLTVAEAMLRCASGGLSVIPINHTTKKTTLATWKPYAQKAADLPLMQTWSKTSKAYAIVCGPASGNVEMMDWDHANKATPKAFDAEDFFGPWWDECGAEVEKYDLPVWKSGDRGYGLAYRCEVIAGSQGLAYVEDTSAESGFSVVIETRGGWTDANGVTHGGYFIAPPSLHPLGTTYEMIRGDLANIPTIPPEVREHFLSVARRLSKYVPRVGKRADKPRTSTPNGDSIIAKYNAAHDIWDCLLEQAYTQISDLRGSRPGKEDSKGVSVDVQSNVSFHWSTNDELHLTNDQGSPLPMDPYDILVMLTFSGDEKAAFEHAKRELGLWIEGEGKRTLEIDPTELEPEPDPETKPEPYTELDLGWITDYTQLMTELTGSPPQFNRLCGVLALSTAVGRSYRLMASWATIAPNFYGAIIAESSFFHKSSSLGKAISILKMAGLDQRLLANEFTPEGLYKMLAMDPIGLVTANEIGNLFGSNRIKYQMQLKGLLTDIFDGQSTSKRQSGGVTTIKEPFLNILGSTTPSGFYDNITTEDWRSGFVPRWIFATVGTSKPDLMPGKLIDGSDLENLELPRPDPRAYKLSQTLKKLAERKPIFLGADKGCQAVLDAWYHKLMQAAWLKKDEVEAAFVSRTTTTALKFAVLFAGLDGATVLRPCTLERGIELAESYLRTSYEMMSDRTAQTVSSSKQQRVLTNIYRWERNKGKPPTNGDLQHHMKDYSASLLGKVLEALEARGAIAIIPKGRGNVYHANIEKLPVK